MGHMGVADVDIQLYCSRKPVSYMYLSHSMESFLCIKLCQMFRGYSLLLYFKADKMLTDAHLKSFDRPFW